MTVPARPVSMRAPCSAAGVISQSAPSSWTPTPRARSASAISSVSRARRGFTRRDGPSASAAMISSRLVSDLDPGSGTVASTGLLARGAAQLCMVPSLPHGHRHSAVAQQNEPMVDARRLWTLLEPIHAVTYFAPSARSAFEAAGLRGFWRGYFAGRLAPLGPVDAPVATAVLFGFAPSMVARGVPGIWSLATPEAALTARLAGVEPVLQASWDASSPSLVRLGELLRRTGAAPVAGHPLFAANAGLPWPDEPRLAVWHAATLLREHRGDAHVAALTAAGLDGCEALVTHVAAAGPSRAALQGNRGWTDEEWAAATSRLVARGWLEDGRLTGEGRAGRAAV